MIRSFACRDTEALFKGQRVAPFVNIQSVAERKLTMLHAAIALDDLKSLPGYRLEALAKNRTGSTVSESMAICAFRMDGRTSRECRDCGLPLNRRNAVERIC